MSMEIGTPERKIIDAVSEAISEAYIDQYITGSLLDINSKSGLELEQFVGIFGFGRLQGRQATGIVTLTMTQNATSLLQVPMGTQFYSSNAGGVGSTLYFSSTSTVVVPIGSRTVDVPVQCTVAGTIGNVPPNAIDSQASSVGSASGTNLTALTGGVDTETDAQLRARFKATLLRNIAGTSDFYQALCLQSRYTTRSTVFGPITTYRTQMTVPSNTTATNVTPAPYDIAYTWPLSSSVFRDLGRTTEVFYTEGIDYTFSNGTGIPKLTVVAGSALAAAAGQIIDVEFEYTTTSSRNNPASGITNMVDIFVDGSDPYTVSESNYTGAIQFSTNTSSVYYTGNFVRGPYPGGTPGTPPSSANFFMRLGSAPVINFPSTITIGGTTYTLGSHYWLVRGTTKAKGSQREVCGIEWIPPVGGGGGGPVQSPSTPMTLTYSYNRLPEVMDAVIAKSKQITTSVMVHESPRRFLKVNLSIEYNRGYDPTSVNSTIQLQLRAFFGALGYGVWVQMSDIILVVHQVIGVDNVWITTQAEAAAQTPTSTSYGVQAYAYGDGTGLLSSNVADFKLNDNELASFLSVNIIRKPTL